MDADNLSQPCPCGKASNYADCCHRFISGKKLPKTPEQTMRSRYAAYALGGCGEYLLNTWFPITARGLSAQELSAKTKTWRKLEVLTKTQNGDDGTVEFRAYYDDLNSSSGLSVLHENSEFKRIAGRWLYIGGRVK